MLHTRAMFEMTRQEQAIVALVMLALIVGAAVRSHITSNHSPQTTATAAPHP